MSPIEYPEEKGTVSSIFKCVSPRRWLFCFLNFEKSQEICSQTPLTNKGCAHTSCTLFWKLIPKGLISYYALFLLKKGKVTFMLKITLQPKSSRIFNLSYSVSHLRINQIPQGSIAAYSERTTQIHPTPYQYLSPPSKAANSACLSPAKC